MRVSRYRLSGSLGLRSAKAPEARAKRMAGDEQTGNGGSAGGQTRYGRILLKLSGEAFAGDQGQGLDYPSVDAIAAEVANLQKLGVGVAVVVGGGNIVRGRSAADKGVEEVTGH